MNSSASPAVSPEAAAALRRIRPALRRYVRFLTDGDEAKADEIVDRAASGWAGETADPGDGRSQLYAAVRRQALSQLTREALTGAEGAEGSAGAGGDESEHETVLRLLGKLTLKQQEVTRLKFQHDFGFEGIAAITGLTPATAGALLHQAVVRVGRVLASKQAGAAVEVPTEDPGLTAYALEELEPAEHVAYGRTLATRPDGRAQVTQLQTWSGAIKEALAVEAGRKARARKRRTSGAGSKRWIAAVVVVGLVAAGVFGLRQEGVAGGDAEDASSAGLEGDVRIGRREGEEAKPNRATPSLRGSEIPREGLVAREQGEVRAGAERAGGVRERSLPVKEEVGRSARLSPAGTPAATPEPEAGEDGQASADKAVEAPAKENGKAATEKEPRSVRPKEARRQTGGARVVRVEGPVLSVSLRVIRPPDPSQDLVARLRLAACAPGALTRPAAHVVVVVDVSRSMEGPNRLPLVREAVEGLLERLQPADQLTLIAYAEKARLLLSATPVERREEIRAALTRMQATGLTNGSEGLELGYQLAERHRSADGVNAVVLCTDGNFNLGLVEPEALAAQVREQAGRGLSLHVFGFGRTDRNDTRLELLAAAGGGKSAYVNTREEAGRLLVEQVDGLLDPVAEETDLHVVFDPAKVAVATWATRALPPAKSVNLVRADSLRPGEARVWQFAVKAVAADRPGPWLEADLRFRNRLRDEIEERREPQGGAVVEFSAATPEERFAVAAAALSRVMLLPPGAERSAALARVADWGLAGLTTEEGGFRRELLGLVEQARWLDSVGK